MTFPTYRGYKYTSVDWLGVIPESWDLFLGKRIFSQRKERAYSDDQQLAASQAYGVIPQKKMMELTGNKVMLALGGTDSFRHVTQDDFVISLRSFEGGIEHSAYDGCVSPAYTVVAPNRTIHPWFYRYLLKSRPYVSALQASTDSLRDGKSITFEQFGDIPLPYPPVADQRQIARFLDHETAKIDALIGEQERLIELLQEKRQAVISHAVTKGLDPDVPMKDSGVKWLGEVPAHWRVLSVKRVAQRVATGGTPSGESPSAEVSEGINWFTPGDFSGDLVLNASGKKVSRGAVESGDAKLFPDGSVVVVGIGATLGKVALIRAAFSANQQINVITPNSQAYNSFLAYSLIAQTEQMRVFSNASTIGIMNQEKTKEVVIAVPPLTEQRAIINRLDSTIEQLGHLVGQAKLAIKILQERRSALISAAVTGKIDVRNWQPPADESAFDEEVRQAGMEATA